MPGWSIFKNCLCSTFNGNWLVIMTPIKSKRNASKEFNVSNIDLFFVYFGLFQANIPIFTKN